MHRQFTEADLEAVAAALELERRYDISPASLAFGLRVLAEPQVRAAVAGIPAWYDDPHGAPDWRAAVTAELAVEVVEELAG